MNKNERSAMQDGGTGYARVSRNDTETLRKEARGRWPAILATLGIPAALLDGKAHPCPGCGGRDRFQFTVRGPAADWGRFSCRSHDAGGGDGFHLLMHVYGYGFADAAKAVAGALGLDGSTHALPVCTPPAAFAVPSGDDPARDAQQRQRRQTQIGAWWAEAVPLRGDDPASVYLQRRGLAAMHSEALRLHPALPYWHAPEGVPVLRGQFAALLAQVLSPDGEQVGLHRVYLGSDGHKLTLRADDGTPLPARKLYSIADGATHGAAIRLCPPEGGRLALAEGIETALAVHEASGLPVWACLSAGGLERVVLPDRVTDVWLFADNDRNQTGQLAAVRLRTRLRSEGRAVRLRCPSLPDTDWLDVLRASKEQ